MKRYLFIVQGEGRGHLTQALAMKDLLEKHGGELIAVFAGHMQQAALPSYFTETFGERLHHYRAPGFILNSGKTGIRLLETFIRNILLAPLYLSEICRLRKRILSLKPDTVINFYELNGALAMRRLPVSIRRISVAHHFYYSHPDAILAPGFPMQRRLLARHNKLVMRSSDLVLALSFRPAAPSGRIRVVPPLLTEEIYRTVREAGTRDLAYFLYPGMAAVFAEAAANLPGYEADVFIREGIPGKTPPGIRVYPLDRELFLERLARCRCLITTSGFESVAEAGYLGIPVLAVPVQNHFEQHCNAADLERAGIGLRSETPDPALAGLTVTMPNDTFREWAGRAGELIIAALS
ncbi:MAG: glycosyltransferase family protein [Bacteroidota bacterium]